MKGKGGWNEVRKEERIERVQGGMKRGHDIRMKGKEGLNEERKEDRKA